MRVRIKAISSLLLTIAAVSATRAIAQAGPPADKALPAELALDYSYLRSNAPPSGCGCFNLNGGSATVAWPVKPGKFAIVADLTIANANNIDSTAYNLTLGIFTAGVRYLLPIGRSRIQPFGQVLAGGAHASGSLVLPPNPAYTNATLAFAANAGGGVDLRLNRRFSIRLAEADYLVTTFQNGVNDHQNNLRLSSGLVIRF
jgi:outer membrane immunogenic protein